MKPPVAPFAPADLPPKAADLAAHYAGLLRGLPVVLAASLLVQVRGYDWQFPAERLELEQQLQYLAEPRNADTERILAAFQALPVARTSTTTAWTAPELFLQTFTAHLWQVHAIEQFRNCGEQYGNILAAIRQRHVSIADRLVLVLIGQGAKVAHRPLFARLRQYGTCFENVDGTTAAQQASVVLRQRAAGSAQPYDHWWVDGGAMSVPFTPQCVNLSFNQLQHVRESLAARVRTAMQQSEMEPESTRSYMMTLRPSDLRGFPPDHDEVVRHFAARVLCDGSGTQTLSTSFVQWTARELLRRAQPSTLFIRFAPRSQNVDFLDDRVRPTPLDAEGALVDADMGAYYTWLNLRRLPSKRQPRFLVVAENGQGAMAIGPGMAAGTTAASPATLEKILNWMSA